MNITRSVLSVVAGLLLAACGSDVPDPVPPASVQSSNEVPASAYASPVAYSSFAAGLAGNDSAEPLVLGSTPAPTSETEEPIPAR